MKGKHFFESVSRRPPFTRMHPKLSSFFRDYLAGEKALPFGSQFVVNTSFPPYPGPAFDNLLEHFDGIGRTAARQLYSVTWAVTNRCSYRCWHCYNAGRSQTDLSPETTLRVASELALRSPVIVTITGGEPMLRDDLEEIVAAFEPRTCLILGTTGEGLTPGRASRLRERGLFAVGISLDSADGAEHDRLRGRPGAFETALRGLEVARRAGLYPYVVAVATRELLAPERFHPFLEFASRSGALEVHLLEPVASGRLAGRDDVVLSPTERERILEYQREVAGRDDLPILSTFTYLESHEAFGCGAGLTHLYVDGSGEVCPCNLVPISFGNVTTTSLEVILEEMGRHFVEPRPCCVGRVITPHVPAGPLPTPPDASRTLCEKHLPARHGRPRFFDLRSTCRDVGPEELRAAYDEVHDSYDEFWLVEAATPVRDLVDRLALAGSERVFEAGCGTGFATALLAPRSKEVVAVDLSEGMLGKASGRLGAGGATNVRLVRGDALEHLCTMTDLDLVFSSWVLGYIPLEPFLAAAWRALRPGGRVAFVVHKDGSPREALDLFEELVHEDPAVLDARVRFDFPAGGQHVSSLAAGAGFDAVETREGEIVFGYGSAREVLDHLLKSGAGTAFHEALVPGRREGLTREFLRRLEARRGGERRYDVGHEYVAFVGRKPMAHPGTDRASRG